MSGENLLKISKGDLNSSVVLYENKNYAQALFYFHQSVEKAAKYLALSCGITENEFKQKIKHNGIKLLKEMAKKIGTQNEFIPMESISFQDFEIIDTKLKTSSNQDVASFLSKQISLVYKEPFPIPIQDMSKPLQLVIDYLIKLGVTHELVLKPFSEAEYVYTEEVLKVDTLKTIATINLNSKIFPLLFSFIVFTNRYKVDDFRYPSSHIGNPLDYFTIDNPYVVELPKFFPVLEKTINLIEKMIEINNFPTQKYYTPNI